MKPCEHTFTINTPSDEGKVSEYILVFRHLCHCSYALHVRHGLSGAVAELAQGGVWFPAVILLWVFIYYLNAWSWYVIIRDGKHAKVPFWKIYKLTVSGFALNYATPVGLMGGEPYRIMELTPYVGASKATSSVILYVMMHIFSHFWFWLVSAVLFVIFEPMNWGLGIMLAVVAFVCLLAIYFFMKGYRNGMAVRTFKLLCHVPYVKRWASRFLTEKKESLERVDAQIAELHKQRKSTFYVALGLEFMARIVGCAEVFFILNILTDHVSLPGLYPDYGLHFLVCQPVLLLAHAAWSTRGRICAGGRRTGHSECVWHLYGTDYPCA